MIVMTFQHKSVLDTILDKGRYYCNVKSIYKNESPKLYKYLQEFMYDKTGIDSSPIFSWSRLLDSKCNIIDLSKPSFNSIFYAIDKVPYHGEDSYLFILDVPSELVVTHDFYDFASFKADEYEELCSDEDLRNFIYNSSVSGIRELQSCFPFIDKSFVKSVYSFNDIRENGISISNIEFEKIDFENSESLLPSSAFDSRCNLH